MPDRDDLILRWELGQTTGADEVALAELLRDPAARRAFARNARVAAALGKPATVSAVPPSTTVFTAGTTRQRKAFRIRPARGVRAPQWAVAASVLLIVGLVAFALTTRQRHGTDVPSDLPLPQAAVPAAVPTAAPFAQLESVGLATIRALDGSHRAGRSGDAIAPGDTVAVDKGAAVIVLHNHAARLELSAGSTLSMPSDGADPATTTVRLSLSNGYVRADVAHRIAGAPFIITTPLASAEVVGTRFNFSTESDGARLAVDDGAVRLSTPKDSGVLVSAGHAGLVSEGLASIAPTPADTDQPLPTGARVLWRADPTDPADITGWRGAIDDAATSGPAWRSVLPRDQDPWCRAELRSPIARAGWAVEAGTWLRFRYHVERFTPGLELVVHLKPRDESNYAQRLIADPSDGWHQALLRVDDTFRHVERNQQLLAVGESIHGAVWCAMRDADGTATAVRFWIRDAVVFVAP